jgi:hypothetical protein
MNLDPGTDQRGAQVLDRPQCMALLGSAANGIGRLGIEVNGQIVVLPFNFALDSSPDAESSVLIRLGPGETLEALLSEPAVVFEVDRVESELVGPEAWSVLVRGTARIVRDAVDLGDLRSIGLTPLTPETGEIYVRIGIESITGRRFNVNALARLRWSAAHDTSGP